MSLFPDAQKMLFFHLVILRLDRRIQLNERTDNNQVKSSRRKISSRKTSLMTPSMSRSATTTTFL